MKLTRTQHNAIIEALGNAIECLDLYHDKSVSRKMLSANLTEFYLRMRKQSVIVKANYSIKPTVAQECALVLAKGMGLFDETEYLKIITGTAMAGLLQKHG